MHGRHTLHQALYPVCGGCADDGAHVAVVLRPAHCELLHGCFDLVNKLLCHGVDDSDDFDGGAPLALVAQATCTPSPLLAAQIDTLPL